MNDSQQIFSIFYAVLYGVLLTSLKSFQAFPWGFCYEKNKRKKCKLRKRLFVSIGIFNILPFIFFSLGFWFLHDLDFSKLCFFQTLLSAIPSLSIFCPYRIFHIILSKNPYWLYNAIDWEKIEAERNFRRSTWGHIAGAIFYFILPLISILLLKIIWA